MFAVRPILLAVFILIGFAAVASLPGESPAAPSSPGESVEDLDRKDVVAPEIGHDGANRPRPERTFDEDQPPPGANRPRPERTFDEDQPPPGANRSRPERTFDEDQPPRDAYQPRPERTFDEEQPRLSSNPSTGPVEIRYGSGELRVDVFDVTGRRIANLMGAGGTASWDGRDTNGCRVGRGIYFARVLPAREGSAKVVRITRR